MRTAIPRQICRGLIEAHAAIATSCVIVAIIPRQICRGLIEAGTIAISFPRHARNSPADLPGPH